MVVILLPAYNEASGIGQLLRRIVASLDHNDCDYHIVVVNDGSTDQTENIVSQYAKQGSITLLSHPTNQGLGKAIKTGISYICSNFNDDDILVTMDADNTHDPQMIKLMVRAIKGGAEVVIGSRFLEESHETGVPLFRRLLTALARILFLVIFPGLGVKDYTSGYRAYRISLLKKAWESHHPLIKSKGFVVMPELLLKLSQFKSTMVEVPLVLRYDRKKSKSKIRIIPTLIEYGKVLICLKLERIFALTR